jgi:hypothetical protein
MMKAPIEALLADIIGDGQFYPASPIRRRRRGHAEMESLRRAIIFVVAQLRPLTLRQLFYALVVRGVIEKSEAQYEAVGRQLLKLRRDGDIEWGAISDNTRWMSKPRTYRGIGDALHQTAKLYRRSLWADAPERVEFWCEKDAMAGILGDVTAVFDVPLYVGRGFGSETYVYNAAEAIIADGRPVIIYEFGDHDPSGVVASLTTARKLREFVGSRAEMEFIRTAVTPEQIDEWRLPSRPTKREGNSHAKGFVGDSVELDAIPPDDLRELARQCIEQHIDMRQLDVLRVAEASERETLLKMSKIVGGAA